MIFWSWLKVRLHGDVLLESHSMVLHHRATSIWRMTFTWDTRPVWDIQYTSGTSSMLIQTDLEYCINFGCHATLGCPFGILLSRGIFLWETHLDISGEYLYETFHLNLPSQDTLVRCGYLSGLPMADHPRRSKIHTLDPPPTTTDGHFR